MTAYDDIGPRVLRVAVDSLYRRLLDDPALAPYFAGIDLARLRAHQRAFLTAVLGGPGGYAGRDLRAAHAGLEVDDAAFDNLVSHLLGVLRDLGVPDAAVAEVMARLEPLRADVVGQPAAADPRSRFSPRR